MLSTRQVLRRPPGRAQESACLRAPQAPMTWVGPRAYSRRPKPSTVAGTILPHIPRAERLGRHLIPWVEAAGVEPAPPQNANWLMARDFRRNLLETRCLVVNSLSSGVLPSLGDIVETDPV